MASPQYRYADGVIYRRDPTPYSYDLRIHDLGRGQVEALASLAMPGLSWMPLPKPSLGLLMRKAMCGIPLLVSGCLPHRVEEILRSVLLQIGNVLPVVQRLKFGGSSRRRT